MYRIYNAYIMHNRYNNAYIICIDILVKSLREYLKMQFIFFNR